jgi:hypothetical protein
MNSTGNGSLRLRLFASAPRETPEEYPSYVLASVGALPGAKDLWCMPRIARGTLVDLGGDRA